MKDLKSKSELTDHQPRLAFGKKAAFHRMKVIMNTYTHLGLEGAQNEMKYKFRKLPEDQRVVFKPIGRNGK